MMAKGAPATRASVPYGEGERRDAARRRKKWLIGVAVAVAGAVPGFYIGRQHGAAVAEGRPFDWPPALTLALAGIYLFGLVGGSILLGKLSDEVERQRGYQAVSFAGLALMVVYPTWFLLWKGGFAAEPVHWVIFVVFWLSLALSSVWYRFR